MAKYDERGFITALDPNEIIVVGTNKDGQHGAGAARQAYEKFGLQWGHGEGLSGSTYALPTMEGLEEFKKAAARFLKFAAINPETTFLLTPVGTGIAGYSIETVSMMFKDCPANVVLDKQLKAAL